MITITPASNADAEALATLDAQCFDPTERWSSAVWADELQAPHRTILLARDLSDDLVGAITISRQFETVDLIRVMVAPTHRRQHVGERLVHEAVWYVRDAERVLLEVRHDNAAALMLYARLGFRAVDRRPDYYGAGRHAVVMQSDLPWEALS